jgi:hypothetical protein
VSEAAPEGRTNAWPLRAYWLVALVGLLVILALNLPGQMTVDSVYQLYEGRSGHRLTFNPWIMSWLLGLFDRVTPGTGLFVTANVALLIGALALLPGLSAKPVRWPAAVVLAGVLATPQLINFQGIVWKDVLFANLTVAGFVSLGLALRKPPPTWRGLIAPLLLLSLAGLVRQNGLIAAAAAALALGVAVGRAGGWKRGAAFGLGGLVAVAALAGVLGAVIQPQVSELKNANSVGLRVIQQYDIVGAVAADPAVDLAPIPPERAAVIRAEGPPHYSDERTDGFDDSENLTRALWQTPKAKLQSAWLGMMLHRPGLYATHRLKVFSWVFLTPAIERCGPAAAGIDGPPDILAKLNMTRTWDGRAAWLNAYINRFYGAPLLSHLFYALLAAALIGALAMRRNDSDLVIIGLLLAGLGFAASFFFLSIACDYRYLYMLDLSALAALVYVALDPPKLQRGPGQGTSRT